MLILQYQHHPIGKDDDDASAIRGDSVDYDGMSNANEVVVES